MCNYIHYDKFSTYNLAEVDYKILESTTKFDSGETVISFCVRIISDTVLENNETFNIIAVPSSLTAKYAINCNATTIVTILDDDGKSVFCLSKVTVYWEVKVLTTFVDYHTT